MAQANSKAAIFLNLALMISLFLLISMAEGRLFSFGFDKSSSLSCTTVYGVQNGDTCFAIQQQFNLTAEDFSKINPNLVCEKIFVGQWLCLSGTP